MQTDELRRCLGSLEQAKKILYDWNIHDIERGQNNLVRLGETLGVDALGELCHPLGRLLPRCADPDMALNNLERYFTNAGAEPLPTLMESRARTLETILQLFSSSQFFSDLLITNPDFLEQLRIPLRSSPSRAEMLEQLRSEVSAAYEDSNVLRAFRRFRQRQMLRIGTNDIIRDRPLEEITRDISRVADTSLEVALETALRNIGRRFGEPYSMSGERSRCVILGFGKLGGKELNYSSDIDLMFLYDEEGQSRGKGVTVLSNDDYFARVCSEVVRLLSASTDAGQAYRVDLRLRPEGHRGPLARSLASTLSYYDTLGRTWERQALIKVRPVAGDAKLGEEFIKAIEPFVYRKYLTVAEINEIKALKRRIEHKSGQFGESVTEVKTGHGGIRDVEFTIQFLQLSNGGDLPDIRQRNTLKAIRSLEKARLLTDPEYRVLDDTYRFLRKVEHRLQLMFDLQTHRLPDKPEELRKLALRMGYASLHSSITRVDDEDGSLPSPHRGPGAGSEGASPSSKSELCATTANSVPASDAPSPPTPGPQGERGENLVDAYDAFLVDYREKTALNRTILNHLLHQSFSSSDANPESDLLLEPNPEPERIMAVLGKYPFRDALAAYQNLNQLATETIPFLESRRCRQFLANIAPQLLRAIAETPDPDMALVNLEKVSASLGGKAVLWELFSFNTPTLKLYVDLCAWSQFLSEILINNPGMIDELLDSLVLNLPRDYAEIRQELIDLCRNADDPDPILHSFQDKELLRIGVRDILGKDSIIETTRALSDVAEAILVKISELQYPPLQKRLGIPVLGGGPRSGQQARHVILGLGKLGGREMSYHSDLDLIVIYEGDGRTMPPPGSTRWDTFELTDNFHFFSELAKQIIKAASYMGPRGRLYQVDMRLRPTGKSGSLVLPLSEFERYYHEGGAQLWERQALTRARVVFGDPDFAEHVTRTIGHLIYDPEWKPAIADEIVTMRGRVEASGSKRDLKRGFGGIIDIEFITQMYRLKHGRDLPALREPNTWRTLDVLHEAGLLNAEEHAALRSCYDFMRTVESRLRIFHNRSLDELPEATDDLEKLAKRLGCEATEEHTAGQVFLQLLEWHTAQTRHLFNELLKRERG
ncbi:MAG TPA: bifunctional [glutamate--ammonia ligase]-adenylyl-L-tyrosine phosphorylase/[glutamate--ammonia-ligase] adenylyltransferase [Gemmataceae bacterium]|nr:bifunctional [glutamate--ammonia ligase]-adenylyl-L-tyrosine phosphorylase/[glutamate--ammonia-ligase] adenylyltransferase [Gemmataceae bacterium]